MSVLSGISGHTALLCCSESGPVAGPVLWRFTAVPTQAHFAYYDVMILKCCDDVMLWHSDVWCCDPVMIMWSCDIWCCNVVMLLGYDDVILWSHDVWCCNYEAVILWCCDIMMWWCYDVVMLLCCDVVILWFGDVWYHDVLLLLYCA